MAQERICISMTLNGIGDAVVGICAAYGYKKKNPAAHVTYAVTDHIHKWVQHCRGLDAIVPQFIAKTLQFDRKVELPTWLWAEGALCRSGKTRQEIWCMALNCEPALPEVVLPAPEVKLAMADKGYHQRKTVLLSPWSYYPLRTWNQSNWAKLEDRLLLQKIGTIVHDVPGDGKRCAEMCKGFYYYGFGPDRVMAQIQRADLVISNDSGHAHLAGLLRKPFIALCGVTLGNSLFSFYPTGHWIQGPLPCTGCYTKSDSGFERGCLMGCDALNSITPKQVLDKALELLGENHA